MNIQNAGWLVAAVLAAGIIGAGFKAPGDKVGTVDVEKVFNESTFAKTQTDNLRNMGEARTAVLTFLDTYKTITAEDAKKLRDLSLKEKMTDAEKAQLEQLKKDAIAAETKYRDLSQKTGASPEELKQVQEFARRSASTEQLIQAWQQEFMQEVQGKQATLRQEALGKVKAAVQKVGRDQGYSVIFDSSVAPYSANDVTDEAMKAMK